MIDFLKDLTAPLAILILSAFGYLLRSKDSSQQRQITLLFEKHDEDVRQLTELKERIAREHYVKGELDARFQRLEDAFRVGFRDLGEKIDHLTQVMIDHIAKGKP